MSINLRLIRGQEFLKASTSGALDFSRAAEMLKNIALTHGETDWPILIDLRHTTKPHLLSDKQIWTLVESVMQEFPDTFRNKLALVDRETREVDREEFFVHCANAKRFPVKLFFSLDAAIEWFGEPSETPEPTS